MAQILVRNIGDDVKDRLRERARRNGRSLEAEVRDILEKVPATDAAVEPRIGLGRALAKKLAKHKVDDDTWKEFEANIAELRRNWRVRTFDFES